MGNSQPVAKGPPALPALRLVWSAGKPRSSANQRPRGGVPHLRLLPPPDENSEPPQRPRKRLVNGVFIALYLLATLAACVLAAQG